MSIQSKNFMKEIGKYLGCYTYDVSIVIVNYNGKKYIDKLFQSLSGVIHDDFTFEVIFVDNNSTDDSVAYLQSIISDMPFKVRIIKSAKNLGFAGGNNKGAKVSRGEYLVLLNNDTTVSPEWLTELYHFIKSRSCVSMVNSKLLFFYDFIKLDMPKGVESVVERTIKLNKVEYDIENKYCKNFVEKNGKLICNDKTQICIPIYDENRNFDAEVYINGRRIVINLTPDEVKDKKVTLIQNAGSGINEAFDGFDIGSGEIDDSRFSASYMINNACGASVIMRRDEFFQSGMFDSRFFMYYEDTDLSYRMKKQDKGIKSKVIMYCPTSVVRHIHTGSSKEWSPLFTYHVYRNKLLFVFKNISKRLYIKQFLRLYYEGKKENNFYKMCGCKDSLKIIMKIKRNTGFRW